MFYEGQIVRGKVAGAFVILALRQMHGEDGAQLKPVNPADLKLGAGELWLPLDAIVPNDKADAARQVLERNAKAYEAMAADHKAADPDRAAACIEMAGIVRGWKNNPEVIARNMRAI